MNQPASWLTSMVNGTTQPETSRRITSLCNWWFAESFTQRFTTAESHTFCAQKKHLQAQNFGAGRAAKSHLWGGSWCFQKTVPLRTSGFCHGDNYSLRGPGVDRTGGDPGFIRLGLDFRKITTSCRMWCFPARSFIANHLAIYPSIYLSIYLSIGYTYIMILWVYIYIYRYIDM